ncbi:MAG: PKD domain-containing protein [Bacteroidetes bacterium]|nr:MAG: PKD domain-containing protein [Bacteroidota bacterium]
MSNSFDDKIKQALEDFEMPYDASAWAALEKQLPQVPTPTPAPSYSGWKIAAGVVIVSSAVATLWFLNQPEKKQEAEAPATEAIVNDIKPVETATAEALEIQNFEGSEDETSNSEAEIPNDKAALNDNENLPSEKNTAPVDEVASRKLAATSSVEEKKTATPIEVTEDKTDHRQFVVHFIPSSLNVCAGADVSFINNSSDPRAQLTWDFGDGTTSTEGDPVHSFVLPGTYTVTLRGAHNDQSNEHSVMVNVNPAPTPMFSSGRKLDGYVAIPLYNFSTGTMPGETAVWSFSDGVTRNGNSATHLFRESGKHKVKLTVSNQFGCSTSVDETITTYEHFNLLAPTAFTPDGDGNNEFFMPKALPEMGIPFEMVIRNQTGQVVFQTTDPNEAWDGTLQNSGQKADIGTYVWTVLLKENVLSKKDFNGTIHLTR